MLANTMNAVKLVSVLQSRIAKAFPHDVETA